MPQRFISFSAHGQSVTAHGALLRRSLLVVSAWGKMKKMKRTVLMFLLALAVAGCVEPATKLNTQFVGPDLAQPKRILVISTFASEVPDINSALGKEIKKRLSACRVDSEYISRVDADDQQRITADLRPDAVIYIIHTYREFLAITDNMVVRYKIDWKMESMDGVRLWGGEGLLFRNRVLDATENVGRKWANDFVDKMIAHAILARCGVSTG